MDAQSIGTHLNSIASLLISPEAIRVYLLLAGVSTLVCALVLAYFQFSFLRNIEDPIEWIEERVRLSRIHRGRPPLHPAARERRRKRIEQIKRNAWIEIVVRFLALLGFGYGVPFVVMTVGIYWYRFLEPAHAPFLDPVSGAHIYQPSLDVVIWFVFDQISRGAASDYMEIYEISSFSPVATNPEAHWIRPVCLVFRYFAEAFTAIIPLFIARASWAWMNAGLRRTPSTA